MTNNPEDINIKIPKNYFATNVKQLQWGGVPMYDVKHPVLKILYLIYCCFMLGTFIYYFTFVEIMYAIKNIKDMDKLLFALSYAVVHVMACAKITVVYAKRKSILKFLDDIEKDKFLPNLDRGGIEEIKLIQGAVALTRNQIILWGVIIGVMLSNRLIWTIRQPVVEYPSPDNENITISVKQLPYTTYYIFLNFDTQKSPYFEIVFIHQILSIWIFAFYMANADTITNGLMIHLTAQFKIVANSLLTALDRAKRMTKKHRKTSNQIILSKTVKVLNGSVIEIEEIQAYDEELAKNFDKCIKACIQHHQDILNLSNSMENTFNMVILAQFLSSLSLYCFLLYQLSTLPLSIKNTVFIGLLLFLLGMIFQLFIFCWNGNELSEASESIAEAAYNAEWIPAPRSTKMLIVLALLRAQRPVYITAGKFSKLSMATFATILRGSVSYFMVLRNANREDQPIT